MSCRLSDELGSVHGVCTVSRRVAGWLFMGASAAM